MQVVVFYLQPFRRSSFLISVSQFEKSLKPLILGVQGHLKLSSLSLLIALKSSSQVFVMISSMSLSLC